MGQRNQLRNVRERLSYPDAYGRDEHDGERGVVVHGIFHPWDGGLLDRVWTRHDHGDNQHGGGRAGLAGDFAARRVSDLGADNRQARDLPA